jgi:uncharacterized protein YcbX
MATDGEVGSVVELWRFPVKSMAGESLDQVELTAQGVVGDRAYALIDNVSGKVVSAKSLKLFPGILDCRASFVEPPWTGHALPPVRITLPNGDSVISASGEADRALSAYFGRDVTLARPPRPTTPTSVRTSRMPIPPATATPSSRQSWGRRSSTRRACRRPCPRARSSTCFLPA